MASEAYKRIMKKIPKEIQRKVEFNLEIADEIYLALENQDLKPADLARKLEKSESEISKWLSGIHNFTLKTIQKIDVALETTILMTKSTKIEEYQEEINRLKERCIELESKCEELEKENNGLEVFSDLAKIEGTLGKQLFSFESDKKDSAKIKSNYKPHSLELEYAD